MSTNPQFIAALHAEAPAQDHTDALELYAFLIGSWRADVLTYDEAPTPHRGSAEIHAGWVLEGRAVQDVWMIPRSDLRKSHMPSLPIAGNWYGSTMRVYDSNLDAWRIFWMDPATQNFAFQIGRRQGDSIVQESDEEKGTRERWSFSDITPDSFHWRGEQSIDGGSTWTLLVEVLAHRTSAGS
jgi:hypothetical protein